MGYFNESGVIKAELLDETAMEKAKSFLEYYFDKRKQQKRLNERMSLSSAQLRRFYGEFKRLEKKVKAEGFDKVKPLIKMTKSKASYAANRPNPIPETFKTFIIDNVNEINSQRDFEAFMLHFEAVVGFFYGIPEVRSN